MDIYLYNNDKRLNSSKQPQSSVTYPYIKITCTLKENTDVLHPIFIVERTVNVEKAGYNYCTWKVGNLDRCYFIANKRYTANNIIELECTIDVLATYKYYIENVGHSQFVTRAASKTNEFLTDTCFSGVQGRSASRTSFQVLDPDNGFYVIGVIHQIGPGLAGDGYSFSRGSVYYYTAVQSEFEALLQFLTSPGAAYADYNPLDHIVSCTYIPDAETGSTVTSPMFVHGGDSFNWSHTKITIGSRGTHSIPIASQSLPNHPQANTIGKYLNYAPYSHYTIFAGPFGSFELDRNILGQLATPSVVISCNVDCATGEGHLSVSGGSGTLVESSGMVGIPIVIAQQTTAGAADLMRMENQRESAGIAIAGNVLGSIAGKPGDFSGLASAAVTAVNASNDYALNAYLANIPKVSMVSSQGSIAEIARYWYIQGEFTEIVTPDIVHFGRPLMEYTDLSTLTGYVQCANARYWGFCGTEAERVAIDSFLNSGFYIE